MKKSKDTLGVIYAIPGSLVDVKDRIELAREFLLRKLKEKETKDKSGPKNNENYNA